MEHWHRLSDENKRGCVIFVVWLSAVVPGVTWLSVQAWLAVLPHLEGFELWWILAGFYTLILWSPILSVLLMPLGAPHQTIQAWRELNDDIRRQLDSEPVPAERGWDNEGALSIARDDDSAVGALSVVDCGGAVSIVGDRKESQGATNHHAGVARRRAAGPRVRRRDGAPGANGRAARTGR